MTTETKPLANDIQAKMEQYRSELLAFDMCEPTFWKNSRRWLFYKPMTELTAFVVNLQGNEFYVEITYGYASTAFTRMAGDENVLVERGVLDEYITVREKVIICDESDEATAKIKVAKMYTAYQDTQKDDLLLFAKEKRKAFIQQIHTRLKPLGFKKKANTWTRWLTDTYYLMFNAQKSAFSDEYYFIWSYSTRRNRIVYQLAIIRSYVPINNKVVAMPVLPELLRPFSIPYNNVSLLWKRYSQEVAKHHQYVKQFVLYRD